MPVGFATAADAAAAGGRGRRDRRAGRWPPSRTSRGPGHTSEGPRSRLAAVGPLPPGELCPADRHRRGDPSQLTWIAPPGRIAARAAARLSEVGLTTTARSASSVTACQPASREGRPGLVGHAARQDDPARRGIGQREPPVDRAGALEPLVCIAGRRGHRSAPSIASTTARPSTAGGCSTRSAGRPAKQRVMRSRSIAAMSSRNGFIRSGNA